MEHPPSWMRDVIVVAGTDTDVGKTIATAALAVVASDHGSVVIDKPAQTGMGPGDVGDAALAAELAGGVPWSEGLRCSLPMAPVAAARHDGVALPPLGEHVSRIAGLRTGPTVDGEGVDAGIPRVIVEGSGGLLVDLDGQGGTLAELTREIEAASVGSTGMVVVTRPDLGTLNHTALTLEAARRRDIDVVGLVMGSWPAEPSLVQLDNAAELERFGMPMLGALPAGCGAREPAEFVTIARTALARVG